MNCEEAKELMRNGQWDLVNEHITTCSDCRAFLEDFGEIAGFLSKFKEVASPSDELFRNTLTLALSELRSHSPVDTVSRKVRTVLAASTAVLFAPVLFLLNYGIALGGQMLLARWLPPIFGSVFFAIHALGAVIAISIAYGSLPLLMAAARNVLRANTAGEGVTI
jgi:predicted anti-sigma-YlaC factor YlaD